MRSFFGLSAVVALSASIWSLIAPHAVSPQASIEAIRVHGIQAVEWAESVETVLHRHYHQVSDQEKLEFGLSPQWNLSTSFGETQYIEYDLLALGTFLDGPKWLTTFSALNTTIDSGIEVLILSAVGIQRMCVKYDADLFTDVFGSFLVHAMAAAVALENLASMPPKMVPIHRVSAERLSCVLTELGAALSDAQSHSGGPINAHAHQAYQDKTIAEVSSLVEQLVAVRDANSRLAQNDQQLQDASARLYLEARKIAKVADGAMSERFDGAVMATCAFADRIVRGFKHADGVVD